MGTVGAKILKIFDLVFCRSGLKDLPIFNEIVRDTSYVFTLSVFSCEVHHSKGHFRVLTDN